MSRNKRLWLLAGLVAAGLAFGAYQSVRIFKDGVQAYLFGYPLVLMDVTRQAAVDPQTGQQAPANHFIHALSFPDHNFRTVVRPNNDTLYSSAWIDLSAEPLVLTVPDTAGRYYVMPFMDAWTNVFAMVGKRTTGTGPGDYLLAGPGWQGKIPANVKIIHSPTNMSWLIGRIQVNGNSDLPNVHKLQERFKLTPLSRWDSRLANPAFMITIEKSIGLSANPSAMVEKMPDGEFFARLSLLLGKHPSAAADAPVMTMLTRFGIEPGKTFDMNNLNIVRRLLLEKAVALTRQKLQEIAGRDRSSENNWSVARDGIGVYGTAYEVRAFVALIGLGALPVQEAAYPNASKDREGKPLDGQYRYRIHFDAGKTPPVDAFWSLTMYDEKGFLVDNPIRRYTIGDRDGLTFNADGSLDIIIQRDRPAQGEQNWLPANKGPFAVSMRLYMPKPDFLNGQWKLPAIERMGGK
jgi:hypothetical protein